MRKFLHVGFAFALIFTAAQFAGAKPQSSSSNPTSQQTPLASTQSNAASAPDQTTQRIITAYTLPPDSYKKSQDLSRIYLRFRLISFAYSVFVLWLILRWSFGPKYRNLAERFSSNKFLQAVVFAPLFFISLDILQLPFGIYSNWILRKYGISVQGWASWFSDWAKGEIITAILSIILLYLLFLVIRKSPRRWWFYF